MATRALQVLITGDSTSLRRSLGTVDDTVDRSEKRIKRFGTAAATAMKGVGLAAAAVGAVGLKQAATAAIEAEKSNARMTTQLKAAGIGFRAHASEIDRVIQKTSQLAGLDDEDLQDAFTNIVRVTGDVNKSLKLTGLAADFARAKHMDVARAGEIVGKVAGGNTGILARYGIAIDKGASSTEALGLLQQKFAGQAESYGKTTAGSVDRASVAWENLLEVLGAKLAPVIQKVADILSNLFDRTSKGNKVIRDLGQAYVTYLGWIRDAIKMGIAWVKRFADRNREDIGEVVRAFRNLARFARNVFEDVLVPVIKRVLPVLRGVAEGIVTALRGMIRIVTGIINGDWKRVWEGVKDIARGAIKALRTILKGLWEAFRDAIKALVPLSLQAAKAIGKAIVKGIISGIKAAPSAIADAISGLIPGGDKGGPPVGRFGKIGEGIGKKIGTDAGALPSGKGAGSLMGARAGMKPFAAVGAKFGLGVVSGLRPGAITSSGNPSWHGTGEALDLGGSPAGMLAFFRYMKKGFGSRLAELIHTPGGAGISRGQSHTFTGQVAADHYDHVHIAYDLGASGQGDGIGRQKRTGDGIGRDRLEIIAAAAAKAGIPPSILYGVYGAESNFGKNMGSSSAGAIGPFQFMPATARGMGVNPLDFKSAAYGAARYLAQYESRGTAGMLAAYNAGPAGNPNNPETRAYIPKVIRLARGWPGVGKGSRGGGGGGSGGGSAPAKAGPGPRFSYGGAAGFTVARESGQVALGRAPGSAVTADPAIPSRGGQVTGYGIDVSRAQRTQAVGRARNNLGTLIKGLVQEIRLKRKRLKLIRKVMRGRIKPARRKRLIEEETQLLGEIGDLAATIKEYRADAAGGATTVTGAEELTAGVAEGGAGGDAGTGGDPEPGPTREDYLTAALAEAGLTPGTEDDRAVLGQILGLRTEELAAARASGDPRRISAAIQAWQAATEALNGVDDSAQRLAEAMTGLKEEMKRQNDIYESVVGVSSREAVKAMADIVSGQIVGVGLQGRRQTAGTGATVLIP